VFAVQLLSRTLPAGLSYEVTENRPFFCDCSAVLEVRPCDALVYIRARGNVSWWDAARACSLHAVAAHIDVGADVNAAEAGSEWTLLHWAAARGSLPVMELAISSGARICAQDRGGCTALHLAARNNRLEAASLLISCGAEVDARDCNRCTPLHMAACRGHCEAMRLLIVHGADINARCSKQKTAVHWAADEAHCQAIRLLIGSNADLNASAGEFGTPVCSAAFEGGCAAVLLLLEAGGVNVRQQDLDKSHDS
jgi:ankyrin repeat protein